jgi:hypothetical protein
MVEVMHHNFLDSIKVAFVVASIIVVSIDEVTIIDNTQWLFIHLYMVQQWKTIPILFCVQTVNVLTTYNNNYFLMLKCLVEDGGFRLEELVNKLISIGCVTTMCFRTINQGWPCNSRRMLHLLSLRFIVLFTRWTLSLSLCWMCLWSISWSSFCTVWTPFLLIAQNRLLNFKSLLICYKPRATNYFAMWRLGGSAYFHM